MIFGSMTKIMGITLVLVTIGSGIYFWWSQNKLEKQAQELLAQKITIETQTKALESLKIDIDNIQNINRELTELERESNERLNKLQDTLRGLERLTIEKPEMVERLINDSVKQRIRCFELATGAKPLKDEKNDVCPQFL